MVREDVHNPVRSLATPLKGASPAEGPGGYLFGTVETDGAVVGCLFRTPPHRLGLTGMPLEAAGAVASAVAEGYPSLPAVTRPPEVA
jgi:hypothetical protein